MALTHVIVQRYYDKKDGDKGVVADLAELEAKRKKSKRLLLFTLSCRFSRLFLLFDLQQDGLQDNHNERCHSYVLVLVRLLLD